MSECICQFCDERSPVAEWKPDDRCPKCGRKYDPMPLLDGDDE